MEIVETILVSAIVFLPLMYKERFFIISFSLYLVTVFLIPQSNYELLGGVKISSLYLGIYLAIISFIQYGYKNGGTSTIIIIYYLGLFLTVLFTTSIVPFPYQIQGFLRDFLHDLSTFFLCSLIFLKIRNYTHYVINTMIIICVVICVYGITCYMLEGFNPYVAMFDIEEVNMLNTTEAREYGESGRFFGRITSVFFTPWACGNYLSLTGVFLLLYYESCQRKCFYWFLICLFWTFVIITGNRSVFVTLFITTLVFLWKKINFGNTLFFLGLIVIVFVLYIFPHIPLLQTYFESIYDSNSVDSVTGSTSEGRYEQFLNCFEVWFEAPFFGHGYNWTSYYRFIHEGAQHPTLLGFESVFISLACNCGFWGTVVWIGFMKKAYKFFHQINPDITFLFLSYIIYILITGIYSSYCYFLIYLFIASHIKNVKKMEENTISYT